MKKIRIFTFIIFVFFASAGFSQIQLGLQGGPQFPMGDFSSGYNTGFGFNLSGKYFVTEDVAFGLNFGYNHFGTDWDDISCSMMPITALAEYHMKGDIVSPYMGIDLGLYNVGTKWVFGNSKMSDSELDFGFAPKAGIAYNLSDNLTISGELKWNYVMVDNDDADWLGLNIGIAFGL
jgi:opacity protein-like surface antigen